MSQVPFNMLSKEYRAMPDSVEEVAALINSRGRNRAQRKKLEKALRKTENIVAHAQKKLDRSAYKEYSAAVEKDMCRFFAILGIIGKKNWNWTDQELEDNLDLFNAYLEEYREYDTDEVAKICEEVTGIILIPEV